MIYACPQKSSGSTGPVSTWRGGLHGDVGRNSTDRRRQYMSMVNVTFISIDLEMRHMPSSWAMRS